MLDERLRRAARTLDQISPSAPPIESVLKRRRHRRIIAGSTTVAVVAAVCGLTLTLNSGGQPRTIRVIGPTNSTVSPAISAPPTTFPEGPGPPATLTISPKSGPAGTTVQLVALYCHGVIGSTILSWFHSSASLADPRSEALVDTVPLQATQAGTTGTFTIPMGTATGQGLFVVDCDSGNLTATFNVTSTPVSNNSFFDQPLATNELVISPISGPVGTQVMIRGRGCNNPGERVADLSFDGLNSKEALPELQEDSQGYFTYTYTIPAQVNAASGTGTRPVTQDPYSFDSHPPYCQASFEVTAG